MTSRRAAARQGAACARVAALCLLGLLSACTRATPNRADSPPDWSGVWLLSSGAEAAADAAGRTDLHLTPRYLSLQTQARDSHSQANMSNCLPAGPTAILQHGVLHEYLFTRGRVTMLFEDGEIRRIYTDGRPHRPLQELKQSYMGDSVAHWDGDTLVVDTIGFPQGELWQNFGVKATLNTHLVERIARLPDGHLRIENEMTDPDIFLQPYHYVREYGLTDLPLEEPVCAQNNRDTGTTLDLTPPPEE